MTREEVIRLAKEVGAYWEYGDFNMPGAVRFDREDDIERFAHLVAAEEREACAAICDEHSDDPVYCGTAIRARGDSK